MFIICFIDYNSKKKMKWKSNEKKDNFLKLRNLNFEKIYMKKKLSK